MVDRGTPRGIGPARFLRSILFCARTATSNRSVPFGAKNKMVHESLTLVRHNEGPVLQMSSFPGTPCFIESGRTERLRILSGVWSTPGLGQAGQSACFTRPTSLLIYQERHSEHDHPVLHLGQLPPPSLPSSSRCCRTCSSTSCTIVPQTSLHNFSTSGSSSR